MDALISAAARALAAGDALGALDRVALRDDPPALALRGIAMAQLGDYARARQLLKLASHRFGVREVLAQARCEVAVAEVELAMRHLDSSSDALERAVDTLRAHGDIANALQGLLIVARRLLLLGRLKESANVLACIEIRLLPPALAAIAEMISAELALRSLNIAPAQAALRRAREAADRAAVASLQVEVEEARAVLNQPAGRRLAVDGECTLQLHEIALLLDSGELVIDACRRGLRVGTDWVPLARRPVLFALLRALAESWPVHTTRETLIARAFKTHRPDETHRARLRVEIGRLRKLITGLARIEATPDGFVLVADVAVAVSVLEPLIAGEQASLLALLADGMAWSTSALALALGASQRTVQRALVELEISGQVRSIGQTRAKRWLSLPIAGFTTLLLLPGAFSAE